MRKSWWKVLTVALLVYTFTAGLLLDVPHLPALQETVRNLYFHVGMWMSMMTLFYHFRGPCHKIPAHKQPEIRY